MRRPYPVGQHGQRGGEQGGAGGAQGDPQCHHCGRQVDSGSDVLGGQWQCGVEVLRTDRYRVAYPIVVPPRSLIAKPSSACLSAMSMSS